MDRAVEVAQAAFIADPKVDTLVSGSVLDISGAAVPRTEVQIVFPKGRREISKNQGQLIHGPWLFFLHHFRKILSSIRNRKLNRWIAHEVRWN